MSNKNISVALLISGHIRTFDETVDNIKKIVEDLNCDVFIHTWDEERSEAMNCSTLEYSEDKPPKLSDILERKISPKRIVIDNQAKAETLIREIFDANGMGGVTKPKGYHFMLYGISKVHEIMLDYAKKANKNYNILVRYRFDLHCISVEKLNIDIKYAYENTNSVIMPTHNWAQVVDAYSDTVFITNQVNYGNIVSSILRDFLLKESLYCSDELLMPELLITQCIKDMNLNIVPSVATYFLIRKNMCVEQRFGACNNGYYNFIKSSFVLYDLIPNNNKISNDSKLLKLWNIRLSYLLKILIRITYPLAYWPLSRLKNYIRKLSLFLHRGNLERGWFD